MRHRGPDSEKFTGFDDKAGFGHQRLSIIDIGLDAGQPMQANGSFIAFNGEVYNYIELKQEILRNYNIAFRTSSDTEVLLAGLGLEGISFLNKCNGMFAFAFYNTKTKEFILGRDRFGVKPLHYMVQDGILYFSSEIKPLIKIKTNLEKNLGIYDSFIRDTATDFNEETFIKGIYQLKKGYYLFSSDSDIKIKPWYFGNDFKYAEEIFEDENKTLEFAELLLVDAINKRLRSDVPVCISLSGGLDSATIYTLIKAKLKKDIAVFTFRSQGSKIDEYEKVKKLTQEYRDSVCQIQSNHKQGYRDIEEVLSYLEFPNWSLSTIAYMDLYKGIKEKGFRVVIEGHGSDEQLGGYPYMLRSAFFEYLTRFNFRQAIKVYKVLNETIHPNLEHKNSLFRSSGAFIKNIIVRKKLDISFHKTMTTSFNYRDFPITLRTFDRLSMRSSVESRCPFMDYRVVEFFRAMPLKYKVSDWGSKTILRMILRKHNKDVIYKDRVKIGFSGDIISFLAIKENKDYLKQQAQKFNMEHYNRLKKKALIEITKDNIGWPDIASIWKIASLSIINQMYGI